MIKTVDLGMKWRSPKVETVGSIKDFLEGTPINAMSQAATAGALSGTLALMLNQATPVSASGIADKMIHAFDPLIELVQGLSYPVGFIMICAGALVIMTGNKQKGLQMMKWAAIGYILMQFAPAIMRILIEVGRAMSA